LLDKYLIERDSSLSADISLILRDYVNALRRFIVEDTELKEIARQLYFRHKDAFDFIFQVRPQPGDLVEPLRALVEISPEFVVDRPGPGRYRFVPVEWGKIKELNSCPADQWTRTGRNLLFTIRTHKSSDRVNVALALGPSDPEFREHMYDWANKYNDIFTGLTKPLGQHTSTIYTHDLLSAGIAESLDDEEKREVLLASWREFLEGHLSVLKKSVSQALEAWNQRQSMA
jgi:hypothetical protein